VVAISHPLDNATQHSKRWRTLCPAEALPYLLRRERARADRIRSAFCVVLVGLRGGQEDADAVAKLGDLVATRARETDEVAVVGARFVCAILPDTPLRGGRRFVDAVRASLNGQAGRTVFEVLEYPSSLEESATEGAAQRPLSLGDRARGHERSLDDDGDGSSVGHGDDRGAVPNPTVSGSDGSETAPLLSAFVGHVARLPLSRSSPSGTLDVAFASPLPKWKRSLDVVVAGTALACLSPLLTMIALAVRLTSGSPVFFRQRRAGLMGKPFEMYKFRTMVVDAESRQKDLRHLSEQDGPAFKLTNDPRITRLGCFLRKTSLDELPQLWNVFKGDMSLVGPRPLPCGESAECTGWQRRRLDVTPGITCIWQVKGRSRVSFHEWMRMDVTYVRTRRFLHDVQLLLLTVPAVLLRRGAR
jgi:lipopolysaccharide/colanic/teichoic acid biosynthesis glycosyltransferase